MGFIRSLGRAIAGPERADEFDEAFDEVVGENEQTVDAVLGSSLLAGLAIGDVRREMKARRELLEAAVDDDRPAFHVREASDFDGHEVVISVPPDAVESTENVADGVVVTVEGTAYHVGLGYEPGDVEPVADDWPAQLRVFRRSTLEVDAEVIDEDEADADVDAEAAESDESGEEAEGDGE